MKIVSAKSDIVKYSASRTARRIGNQLVLPVFMEVASLPSVLGASYIATEFRLSGLTEDFSFMSPVIPPANVNFCLCIRVEDGAGLVLNRYKLWSAGEVEVNYPNYQGETLDAENTILEAWTTENLEVSLDTPYSLTTSILAQTVSCCEDVIDEIFSNALSEFCALYSLGTYDIVDHEWDFPFQFTLCPDGSTSPVPVSGSGGSGGSGSGSLVAEFTTDVVSGSVPLTVKFTSLATGNPDQVVWFFGDGNYDYGDEVYYTYMSTGSYSVTQVIYKGASYGTELKSNHITVNP